MTAAAAVVEKWSERYEALRGQVVGLGDHIAAAPLGFELVLRLGVAGWMRTWRAVDLGLALPGPVRTPSAGLKELPGLHRELTVLLAQMTAHHLSSLSA